MSNCDNCKNSEICKFEEEAKEFENKIQDLPHPEVTTAYISCKKFRSKVDPSVTYKKVSKELKDGKSVSDVAKEFNMSESKVRFISESFKS